MSALSSKLANLFASVTNDTTSTEETTLLATVVSVNDDTAGTSLAVQIDGSSVSTPAITTVDVIENDRVLVLIKNHQAIITSNLTNLSTNSLSVENLVNSDGTIEKIIASLVTKALKVTNSFEVVNDYYQLVQNEGGFTLQSMVDKGLDGDGNTVQYYSTLTLNKNTGIGLYSFNLPVDINGNYICITADKSVDISAGEGLYLNGKAVLTTASEIPVYSEGLVSRQHNVVTFVACNADSSSVFTDISESYRPSGAVLMPAIVEISSTHYFGYVYVNTSGNVSGRYYKQETYPFLKDTAYRVTIPSDTDTKIWCNGSWITSSTSGSSSEDDSDYEDTYTVTLVEESLAAGSDSKKAFTVVNASGHSVSFNVLPSTILSGNTYYKVYLGTTQDRQIGADSGYLIEASSQYTITWSTNSATVGTSIKSLIYSIKDNSTGKYLTSAEMENIYTIPDTVSSVTSGDDYISVAIYYWSDLIGEAQITGLAEDVTLDHITVTVNKSSVTSNESSDITKYITVEKVYSDETTVEISTYSVLYYTSNDTYKFTDSTKLIEGTNSYEIEYVENGTPYTSDPFYITYTVSGSSSEDDDSDTTVIYTLYDAGDETAEAESYESSTYGVAYYICLSDLSLTSDGTYIVELLDHNSNVKYTSNPITYKETIYTVWDVFAESESKSDGKSILEYSASGDDDDDPGTYVYFSSQITIKDNYILKVYKKSSSSSSGSDDSGGSSSGSSATTYTIPANAHKMESDETIADMASSSYTDILLAADTKYTVSNQINITNEKNFYGQNGSIIYFTPSSSTKQGFYVTGSLGLYGLELYSDTTQTDASLFGSDKSIETTKTSNVCPCYLATDDKFVMDSCVLHGFQYGINFGDVIEIRNSVIYDTLMPIYSPATEVTIENSILDSSGYKERRHHAMYLSTNGKDDSDKRTVSIKNTIFTCGNESTIQLYHGSSKASFTSDSTFAFENCYIQCNLVVEDSGVATVTNSYVGSPIGGTYNNCAIRKANVNDNYADMTLNSCYYISESGCTKTGSNTQVSSIATTYNVGSGDVSFSVTGATNATTDTSGTIKYYGDLTDTGSTWRNALIKASTRKITATPEGKPSMTIVDIGSASSGSSSSSGSDSGSSSGSSSETTTTYYTASKVSGFENWYYYKVSGVTLSGTETYTVLFNGTEYATAKLDGGSMNISADVPDGTNVTEYSDATDDDLEDGTIYLYQVNGYVYVYCAKMFSYNPTIETTSSGSSTDTDTDTDALYTNYALAKSLRGLTISDDEDVDESWESGEGMTRAIDLGSISSISTSNKYNVELGTDISSLNTYTVKYVPSMSDTGWYVFADDSSEPSVLLEYSDGEATVYFDSDIQSDIDKSETYIMRLTEYKEG